MPGSVDQSQTRVIADQVAEAALHNVLFNHPELRKVEIPAPLKWGAAVIAGLLTVSASGMMMWLFATVSNMQVTLARIDERQLQQQTLWADRFADVDRRVTKLEGYHSGGNR